MKWSILIATLGRRTEKFLRLVHDDLKYIEDFDGDIEVIAYWNNREKPLGHLRQALVEEAQGEYVCFVDDDDRLPGYYLGEVYQLLDSRLGYTDYVGWKMQYIHDGIPSPKLTYHSLDFNGWYEDEVGFYRDVSHLNPVRRDLALKADFRIQVDDHSEDRSWAAQLRPYLGKQSYIDKVMYYYQFNSKDSSWKPGSVGARPYSDIYVRPEIKVPHFRYHPDSAGR